MEKRLGASVDEGGAGGDQARHRISRRLPSRKRFDAEYLREALERSRERLKRDSVDVVLLHNPSTASIENGVALDSAEVAPWSPGSPRRTASSVGSRRRLLPR